MLTSVASQRAWRAGAQMAVFTAEGQPFHLVAGGVAAFAGLPPRR